MNAKPAQTVPTSGWTGGRMLGVDGFLGGLWPPQQHLAAHADGYSIIWT
jgi:hypothetical protein